MGLTHGMPSGQQDDVSICVVMVNFSGSPMITFIKMQIFASAKLPTVYVPIPNVIYHWTSRHLMYPTRLLNQA